MSTPTDIEDQGEDPGDQQQPRMLTGWLCPRCQKVNAPFTPACDCKPAGEMKMVTNVKWFIDGIPAEEWGRLAWGTITEIGQRTKVIPR